MKNPAQRIAARWIKRSSWMKVKKFLGVRSPLFHATTGPRAFQIFTQGLKSDAWSNYGGDKSQMGFSFTRDLSFALKGNFGPFVFVFDQDQLRSKYKTSPLQTPWIQDEFEERVQASHIPASMIKGLVIDRSLARFEREDLQEQNLPFPVIYRDRKLGWTAI